jgi:Uma2 family endonuclease
MNGSTRIDKEPSMSAAVLSSEALPNPPLRNGDHLTRDEFERRYDAMPDLKKAELIEGVVYMPSPVRMREHGTPHVLLSTWIGNYQVQTPGTQAGSDTSVRLDLDNEPQPDVVLMIEAGCGGRATINSDGYLTGGPELVAEVATSTVSMARNRKMQVYRRHGICEYVIWRVEQNALDWFVLQGEQYVPLPPDPDGIVRSQVFPGLWLDVAALLSEDLPRVFAVLQQGLASAEHQAFVARLQTPPTA